MEVEYPSDRELTAEEAKELENLKVTIEKAIEDGFLSRVEFETIKTSIFRQGITTAEQIRREIALYRQLVKDKAKKDGFYRESPQ